MRASTICMIIAGILVGLVGAAIGIYTFVERPGGKLWFYWLAPLLAIGFAFVMINLTVQYWRQVGRLEVKGRPRR